jgi:hypothetical protein
MNLLKKVIRERLAKTPGLANSAQTPQMKLQVVIDKAAVTRQHHARLTR